MLQVEKELEALKIAEESQSKLPLSKNYIQQNVVNKNNRNLEPLVQTVKTTARNQNKSLLFNNLENKAPFNAISDQKNNIILIEDITKKTCKIINTNLLTL